MSINGVDVVSGHGLSVKVNRGQLAISDAQGTRNYPRAGHGLRRIVVIGESGNITLSAMQWCEYLGIPIVVIAPNGQILSTSCYAQSGLSATDGRLRRAQALTADTRVGLTICHDLLAVKLELSADVIEQYGEDDGTIARYLRRVGRADIRTANTVDRCREMEGEAAAVYFGAWKDVSVSFCKSDKDAVPANWLKFDSRNSRATKRRTAQKASNPVNAVLNYLYTIAATECRLACFALGLDPTMGFLHNDAPNRDSLVWDLMETVRPVVDSWALAMFREHVFSRGDFLETRTGNCRVEAPLTHTLAATGPIWAQAVAPHAETLMHTIAKSSPYPIRTSTRLTASKMRTAQGKREFLAVDSSAHRAAFPDQHSCTSCGIAA